MTRVLSVLCGLWLATTAHGITSSQGSGADILHVSFTLGGDYYGYQFEILNPSGVVVYQSVGQLESGSRTFDIPSSTYFGTNWGTYTARVKGTTFNGTGFDVSGVLQTGTFGWNDYVLSFSSGSVVNHVSWAFKNNDNATRSIQVLVGGSVVRTLTLNALATTTFNFDVEGAPGTTIEWDPSPAKLNANYDPMIIGPDGSTIERSGEYGLPRKVWKVTFVFTSYALVDVPVAVELEGTEIGTLLAKASSDGESPTATSFTYNVSMQNESFLFSVPSGHYLGDPLDRVISDTARIYYRSIDKGPGFKVSTSVGTDGSVTTTSTNTGTGTTSIGHSAPGTPAPGTVAPTAGSLNGSTGSTGGAGGSYGNTTSDAASAAAQASASSLANIDRNVQKLREKSDAEDVQTKAASENATEEKAQVWLTQATSRASSAPKLDESTLPGKMPSGEIGTTARPGAIATWAIAGHEIKISLDPTDSVWNGAHNLLHACRELILWAMVVAFCWSCISYGKTYMANLAIIPQVSTTSDFYQDKVPLWSMLKGWITATSIVSAAVIAVGALIGLMNTHLDAVGFSLTTLHQVKNTTQTGGAAAVLSDYLPLAAMVQLGIGRVLFGIAVLPIYQGAATLIRFLRI